MTTKVKTIRKVATVSAAALMSCSLLLSQAAPIWTGSKGVSAEGGTKVQGIRKVDGVDTDLSAYFNSSVVQKLPSTVKDDDIISVIVKLNSDTLLDAYGDYQTKAATVGEFALSSAGKAVSARIAQEGASVRKLIDKAGVSYTLGARYDAVLSGFEISIRAKDFEKVDEALAGKATAIVSEVYEECESQVVENDVNVYETGIFDSSDSKYDGTGTVVAILDTGLDYTHSAFDVSSWSGDPNRLNLGKINEALNSGMSAADTTAGLTASDVYLNAKVPYAYDYADKDPDVFPIQSEHGTHVAGIIAGNDDTITGVAPNTQLAIMKVFSDAQSGARTSWLLAALNDCVKLNVDVINMSLGSSCGFSREVDEVEINEVYDKIAEAGISLIVAASNDYNSTHGSEKNGNLGLTTNPDSATVGSPSTYEGALSVASVSGVKTYYLTYGDSIMYFTESTNKSSEPKKFVDELLADGTTKKDFEYVTIPGIGLSADYSGLDVSGKIVLVRRGTNSFEDKTRIALEKGAAGLIIYNNVSGDIAMTVGNVFKPDGTPFPVCSISQDDGEVLARNASGIITVSKNQAAGPFMSGFSSWGPTPDLRIKPEITAHGGDILSAVPGQRYDRLSGTSMACPNQAGFTALVRQYVKETFTDIADDPVAVNARLNQIVMSTTDIAYNTNGLPYAVRKQGAGLANLTKATGTPAYLTTFDSEGGVMSKTKLELGDDKDKTGVYTMTFGVNNTSARALSYDVGAIVMTEGVSETLTHQGDRTVTEKGYALNPEVKVTAVEGGSYSGNKITVPANANPAKVTVTVTLSSEDKNYLDTWFANGMYVEGFVTLDAVEGTDIDLSVCYLAFYGDWTQAPIFDLDYFETNRDELDDSIDTLDKTLPDAYATQPIGGMYNDYIAYLGSYLYIQDPSLPQISADRNHIALTNQTGEDGGVNSIRSIWAGLLRGAKSAVMTITDAATGEVIFTKTEYNNRKSHGSGGTIYMSSIDVDFDLEDYDLKNNTQYLFKMTAYLDYGDGGVETNLRNTFEFPFTVDFEAPIVTDTQFYTEYDRTEKKTRLFARIGIYDNHYAMAASVGSIFETKDPASPAYDPDSEYMYSLRSFNRYLTPITSEYNSTSYITVELTDHLQDIKKSYNKNSIMVNVSDYAGNQAVYEIAIPDEVQSISFKGELNGATYGDEFVEESGELKLNLRLNETYTLEPQINISSLGTILDASLADSWKESLTYTSSNEAVAGIVNGKLIARSAGIAVITATANTDSSVSAHFTVTVDGDGYDKPVADSFSLSSYTVDKVFYFGSSDSRDLGATEAGQTIQFTTSFLKMLPSEAITVDYKLDAFFPDDTDVVFESNNSNIVAVEEIVKNGKKLGRITAVAEGTSSVSVRVLMKNGNGDYAPTYYSATLNIEVKNPYTTQGPYLMSYMGNGGEVVIPADLGVTEIYQYAFSNYHQVPKEAGDEISKEDPYLTKTMPIGEDTITKVVIPEGVKVIQAHAFSNLTALTEVVLPSTLTQIDVNAFYRCENLSKVTFSGENNLQFINNNAFYGCKLESIDLASIVAIGTSAFYQNKLTIVRLPETAQSIGANAFRENGNLAVLTVNASRVKLGEGAFYNCGLVSITTINASVIPSNAFFGNTRLTNVTLGKDVAEIGYNAFANTGVSAFKVADGNKTFYAQDGGKYLTDESGKTILLVAPNTTSVSSTAVEKVGKSAFSGGKIASVNLPNVTVVEENAFYDCSELASARLTLGSLKEIGEFAFAGSGITRTPTLAKGVNIGTQAFYATLISSVTIPDEAIVGEAAFYLCPALTSVKIGDDVKVGEAAFMAARNSQATTVQSSGNITVITYLYNTTLATVEIGKNVEIGESAFEGAQALATLTIDENVIIGDRAFFAANANSRTPLTVTGLENVKSIGAEAFAGILQCYVLSRNELVGTQVIRFAPEMENVNLASAKQLGEYAFYGATVKSVTLGTDITEIPAGAFGDTGVSSVTGLERVTAIGAGAFLASELTTANLSNASVIGALAFSGSEKLTTVTLKDDAMVGEEAFANCTALTEAVNLGKAFRIHDRAFMNTSLTKADCSNAIYIGDFAFFGSKVTEVILGEYLDKYTYQEIKDIYAEEGQDISDEDALFLASNSGLGDNPFAGCDIAAFKVATKNGNVAVRNYDLSETVKIINGTLYQKMGLDGGYVLVAQPVSAADTTVAVEEGTVRISAYAFYANKNLVSVELPRTLKAIGDRAFYGCNKLSVVTFKSISAPVMEEAYDTDIAEDVNDDGVPLYYVNAVGKVVLTYTNGTVEEYGLELVPFRMWSVGPVNVLYGANFVGKVSENNGTVVMVRPTNGANYDSFILDQYFAATIDGAAAAQDETLELIASIAKLPEAANITLNDEATVAALRARYDQLPIEQQALVSNYNVLTNAETVISSLKQGGDTSIDPPKTPQEENNALVIVIVLGVLTGVFAVTTAVAVVLLLLARKKYAGGTVTTIESVSEEQTDDNNNSDEDNQ